MLNISDFVLFPDFGAPDFLAAAGPQGLWYTITASTIVGKIVLLALFFVSIVSWSVMFTKFKQVRVARREGSDFLRAAARKYRGGYWY